MKRNEVLTTKSNEGLSRPFVEAVMSGEIDEIWREPVGKMYRVYTGTLER